MARERGQTLVEAGGPGCFDDQQAVAYLEGRASPSERDRVERHAGDCAECRVVLSELARAAGGGGEPTSPARGTRVGRYVVLSRLGAGAMGVVYAAFDPELERKVALKLLDPLASDRGEARARRLQGEARAMARVSHENVVPVFDVGTWAGRVFVAMELVDGPPLSRWLRDPAPARAAVLSRLLEAGRGLEAAHRAGIVHRDFKPDNVLVDAARGARVTDFGLSSAERPAAFAPEAWAARTPSASAEGLVGTPAYMAPEQLRGERADALSDQFAYCVTAYEALCGRRPFVGKTVGELLAAIAEGPPAPGGLGRLPRRVRRALARGLRARPEERFESMTELLAALQPGRSRALAWAAVGAGAGGVAFGVASLLAPATSAEPSPCVDAESHLVGVWGDVQKAGVRAALEGAGPVGRDAWPRVEASLDRHARAWIAARGEACRATYARREQSEVVLALRYACLDRRLAELGALTSALAGADRAMALHAADAAEGLSRPAECADVPSLLGREPLPPGPANEREAQAVGRAIEAGKARYALGRFHEALELGRAALESARAFGHRPLEAESSYQVALAATNVDDWEPAESAAVDAYRLAEAGRDDALKVQSAALLSSLISRTPARQQEALRWSDLGLAALARVAPSPALEALVLANRGILLSGDSARLDEAAALLARSLETGARADVPISSRSRVLHQIGLVRYKQGRFAEARPLFEQSCALTAQVVGPDHPDVGFCEEGVGSTYGVGGQFEQARAHFERARDVLDRALGAGHPQALTARFNLCLLTWTEGDRPAAVACQRDMYRRALEALDPGDELVADAALQLASFLADEQPREALRLLDGARGDEQSPARAAARGRARLALGDRRQAVVDLRRAAAALHESPDQAHELAEVEFALCRALGPTAEAQALARRAHERLRDVGQTSTPLALALDRWLASAAVR